MEYKKILTGKIDYEVPTSDLNRFEGFLKLRKDPKIQNLNIDNLILRGSIIKSS